MYPLTKLIYDKIGNDAAKKEDLMRKLGFTKPSEAEEEFQNLVQGRYAPETLEKLRAALGTEPDEFDRAATESIKRAEREKAKRAGEDREVARTRFKPYLEVIFERFTPTGFMNAMRASHFRKVRFGSEMLEKPLEEQLQFVKESIRAKYGTYGSASDLFPTLGRILLARYYYEFESFIEVFKDTGI